MQLSMSRAMYAHSLVYCFMAQMQCANLRSSSLLLLQHNADASQGVLEARVQRRRRRLQRRRLQRQRLQRALYMYETRVCMQLRKILLYSAFRYTLRAPCATCAAAYAHASPSWCAQVLVERAQVLVESAVFGIFRSLLGILATLLGILGVLGCLCSRARASHRIAACTSCM